MNQSGGNLESDRVVKCAKCGRASKKDEEVCERCGAHLYVYCRDCGEKNERSISRCMCGADLHHPRRRKSMRRLVRKRIRQLGLPMVLIVVGGALTYLAFFLMTVMAKALTALLSR